MFSKWRQTLGTTPFKEWSLSPEVELQEQWHRIPSGRPEGFTEWLADVSNISPRDRFGALVTLAEPVQAAVFGADATEAAQERAASLVESAGVPRIAVTGDEIAIRHVLPYLVSPEDLLRRLREGSLRRQGGVVVEGTARALLRLSLMSGVASIEEEVVYRSNLNSVGPVVAADRAFNSGFTGRGVTVAVIDTGIDMTHPAFAGRISPLSRNFITSSGASSNFTDSDGHGTHVAGIVGGDGSPSGAFRGIAPGVELSILKAYASVAGAANVGDILAALQYAIEQKADVITLSAGWAPWDPPRLRVPPPWLWSSRTTAEESAFTGAPALGGCVTIAAAGNCGNLAPPSSTIMRPGTCEHVLTVGSVDLNATSPNLSSFSSQGPVQRSDVLGLGAIGQANAPHFAGAQVSMLDKPDVLAPGGEMNYAAPPGRCACPAGQGVMSAQAAGSGMPWTTCAHPTEPYTSSSGTSMAAPVVAGLAALIIEYARTAGLSLAKRYDRAFIVGNIIRATARDLGLARCEQGYGLADWAGIERTLKRIESGQDYLDNYSVPPAFPR